VKKSIYEFMGELGEVDKLTIGNWGDHAPGHRCTNVILEPTQECIVDALKRGVMRIHIGNTRVINCERLSTINSRYHGKQIRTITAYF